MTLPAGTRLGPYEILAPLGAGGMGEVYRARDKKLDRDVAIKVLPQSVAADPDTLARFEREAKAVAALSHPNILAIFDFGTHDGISYAVMELLEGETLRHRLDYLPIPQKQAVDYALQVAKGLSAAHQKGVIHRDLRPENIFVTKDRQVKILDFGLAKKVGPSAPTASSQTEPGTVMGTAGYMSPEQVKGLQVDHRSDIFSFGTILYELLSGKKAFKRDTNAETMAAIMNDEPPELSESGRSISPGLDHIVRHCLEKDRDNRFQTAKDVAFALSEQSSLSVGSGARGAQFAAPATDKKKVLIAVVAVVVLAVVGVILMRRPHRGAGEAGGVKRVAVLPFENLGVPGDDYFADGIADAVRGTLTTLPGIQVIARASSTPYKMTTKAPGQIARELGVGYLLTATVRWQKGDAVGSRVEVSPELVEISGSGAPVSKWQQPFDAALTDVFQVQSDIATRVAQALGVALGAGEQKRLSEKPTQNLAAYDAFLKGEELSKGVGDSSTNQKAAGFYEQAVALDPGFAQAWAQLSLTNSNLYYGGIPTHTFAERARQAAEKAVALAPDRPEGYLARGTYHRLVVLDLNRALEEYAEAQRISPGNADLIRGIAQTERFLGRWQSAEEHFRQAERLDPRPASLSYAFIDMLVRLRRYREARSACDRLLALAPANLPLIEEKALTFLGEGDLAGARSALKAAPTEVAPTALVAFVAVFYDLVWVLEEPQRELLLRLTPSAFGEDRGTWAICLVQAYALRDDTANVRIYAEEAMKTFDEQLREAPQRCVAPPRTRPRARVPGSEGRSHSGGRTRPGAAAVREGCSPRPVLTASACAHLHPRRRAGEGARPIGTPLEDPLLPLAAWLKIDPNFDPLRKNPRLPKLVAGT